MTVSTGPFEAYPPPFEREGFERALPPSAATSARWADRADLVLHKGRFAVSIIATTPYEAMIEDLLFIREALDRAGVRYLLVRGNDERPVLAVDRARHKELFAALSQACVNVPLYSKTVDAKRGPAVLVADGRLSRSSGARIFRLFRPRVHVPSGLSYGASTGVQVELWSFGSDEIVLPVENSLTRRSIRPDEAVRGSVERFGRTRPTIEDMFAEQATDIGFDIDLVFSWVDGSSLEWQAKRAERMNSYAVGDGDESDARFRQIDELRYALRSAHMYVPWVRRIFIATDSDRPTWLAEHPRVTAMVTPSWTQPTTTH